MRQHRAAGDKLFVDYSGKKVPIVDPDTGVVREAEIFVAVLGALEGLPLRRGELEPGAARLDRGARAPDRFLGGVPRLIVPDNLKSGVHRPRSTIPSSTAAMA